MIPSSLDNRVSSERVRAHAGSRARPEEDAQRDEVSFTTSPKCACGRLEVHA
jgi:hypothetical protein